MNSFVVEISSYVFVSTSLCCNSVSFVSLLLRYFCLICIKKRCVVITFVSKECYFSTFSS